MLWKLLHNRYQGKGKQQIVFLIGELFRGTLFDDSVLELQLNKMTEMVYALTSLVQLLDDSLVAIAMVLSLLKSYLILRQILMNSNSMLLTNLVKSAVMQEERIWHQSSGAVALKAFVKGPVGRKHKHTASKVKCMYCQKKGHTREVCQKQEADNAKGGKLYGKVSKDAKDAKGPADTWAKVVTVLLANSNNTESIWLFVAQQLITGHQSLAHRWIIDSSVSAPCPPSVNGLHTTARLRHPNMFALAMRVLLTPSALVTSRSGLQQPR